MDKKTLGNMSLELMIIFIIIKITGFAREVIFTYYYGTSYISDIYSVSRTVIDTFMGMLIIGISTTYIPLYSEIEHKGGEKEAITFTDNLITTRFYKSMLITFITFLLSQLIVYIVAPGFNSQNALITRKFIRIISFTFPFSIVSAVYRSYLTKNNEFFSANFGGVISNIIIIFTMILSRKRSIMFLPIGILLGNSLPLLYYIMESRKYGYKYKYKMDKNNKYIKEYRKLIIPIVIGLGINQINEIIDKNIASKLMEGGISILFYSSRINILIFDVVVVTISTIFFSKFSEYRNNNNYLKILLKKSIDLLFYIIIPLSISILLYSKELIYILFERGEFSSTDTLYVSKNLILYSLSLLFMGINEIYVRLLYSKKDVKKVTMTTIILAFNNILFSLILSRIYGIYGISLGTSLSIFIRFIMLKYIVDETLDIKTIKISIEEIKIFIASIISIFSVYFIFYRKVYIYNIYFRMSLISIISIILYLILSYILNIKAFMDLFKNKTLAKND